MEGEIGTMAAGARANLVAFDADPFADITKLGRPEQHLKLVVKDGAIKHDRRRQ